MDLQVAAVWATLNELERIINHDVSLISFIIWNLLSLSIWQVLLKLLHSWYKSSTYLGGGGEGGEITLKIALNETFFCLGSMLGGIL